MENKYLGTAVTDQN